jgi:protein MPE1
VRPPPHVRILLTDPIRAGHWIQDCPTNADRAWDDRPRIKRTTGIPKSFLTTVEGPGTDNTAAGMMVTAEGGFVIAKPDK